MIPEEKLIFIFALPRSGSTLLQKLLLTSNKIEGGSEKWIMLPLLNLNKSGSSLTTYGFNTFVTAFKEQTKNSESAYKKSLKEFILSYYSLGSDSSAYTLDKSPRYYLIAEELMQLFPRSKFIFLFRNPLDILTSRVRSWGKNRLDIIWKAESDTFQGPKMLYSAYSKSKKHSLAVTYWSLVKDPNIVINDLKNFLELEESDLQLEKINFSQSIGELGDDTGIKKFNELSDDGINSFVEFNRSLASRLVLKSALRACPEELLNEMSLSRNDLKRMLKPRITNLFKIHWLIWDCFWLFIGLALYKTDLFLWWKIRRRRMKLIY